MQSNFFPRPNPEYEGSNRFNNPTQSKEVFTETETKLLRTLETLESQNVEISNLKNLYETEFLPTLSGFNRTGEREMLIGSIGKPEFKDILTDVEKMRLWNKFNLI